MLNYETLLSSYDDKLTLMQWLKKVEEALKDASAVSFNVNKRGDATLTFSVVFEDGSELETDPIILQQGESVQGATIRNGHLILTLTNGDELDAGDLGAVSGFSINASQHLIVTYQNGTTQDLGAIFSGNVVISGNFEVTGLAKLPSIKGDENGDINVDADITISDGNLTIGDGAVSTPILTSESDHIEAQKPVIEVMNGYSFQTETKENLTTSIVYSGVVKNGNKLTFAVSCELIRTGTITNGIASICSFYVPSSIAALLYPAVNNWLDFKEIPLIAESSVLSQTKCMIFKYTGGQLGFILYDLNNALPLNDKVYGRIEATFLLSDNLAA